MSGQRGVLPTLTEVITLESDATEASQGPSVLPDESLPMELQPEVAGGVADELIAQVLMTLRPRIDALLKERLREVLATQLSQLAEETVYRVRGDVADAVHALAADAVREVLARQRKP